MVRKKSFESVASHRDAPPWQPKAVPNATNINFPKSSHPSCVGRSNIVLVVQINPSVAPATANSTRIITPRSNLLDRRMLCFNMLRL